MGQFFDSNIILHLTDADPRFNGISKQLIGAGGVISTQVLNETANVMRRNLKFSWVEVGVFLEALRANCNVVPLSLAVHDRGLAYAERYQLHVYDAMIIASAVLAGCTTLWSEDMHDGLVIDGLTIRNPYALP